MSKSWSKRHCFNTASGMPCANPVPWKPWYQWAENVVCGAEAAIEVLSSKNLRKTCTKPYPHWRGAHSMTESAQSPAGTPYTIRITLYHTLLRLATRLFQDAGAFHKVQNSVTDCFASHQESLRRLFFVREGKIFSRKRTVCREAVEILQTNP